MVDIVRREPFETLSTATQMLSRVMDEFFGRGFWGDGMDEGTLPVDIYETPEELVVEASLPGFKTEDIDVQLHQGVLSIKAQRPEERPATGNGHYNYYRRERPRGAWSRRIALPGVVHDAEVRAELKDGVLTLHVPIPERARPKAIEIKAA